MSTKITSGTTDFATWLEQFRAVLASTLNRFAEGGDLHDYYEQQAHGFPPESQMQLFAFGSAVDDGLVDVDMGLEHRPSWAAEFELMDDGPTDLVICWSSEPMSQGDVSARLTRNDHVEMTDGNYYLLGEQLLVLKCRDREVELSEADLNAVQFTLYGLQLDV